MKYFCVEKLKGDFLDLVLPILTLSFAFSAVATQGITAQANIIVDVWNMFYGGLYVAISRAKELVNIFLTEAMTPKNFAKGEEFRQTVHKFYEIIGNRFKE